MVETRKLPPELTSLVHHIELNKAGWWDKAIQQLIVASIWLSGESLTRRGVQDRLQQYFAVKVDDAKAASQIDALCASDTLVALQDDHFKISEHNLREFEEDLKEFETVQDQVRGRFSAIIRELCPSIDPEATWQAFNDELLVPLVHDMGAMTYELVSGTRMDLAAMPRLHQFLRAYPPPTRQALRAAVIAFLDPGNASVRSWVLRQLNAFFFVEAGNLAEETVRAVTEMLGKRPSFTVFVDTNLLFCLLGLDARHQYEIAQSLAYLVGQLSGKVDLKLCLSPITVDEATRVLRSCEYDLEGLRLGPGLAQAALASGISGIARTFIQKHIESSHALAAQDYFGLHIENLIRIAKERSIALFDSPVDEYRTRQYVVDDINEELQREKRFAAKAKGVEQLTHDVVLWHFVRDQRPARMDSPLDAGCWIATLDFRFLGFDSRKRCDDGRDIPVCVHPASLIQMLQLWSPRTQEFEKAILANLSLPFLLQQFDPGAEKVTVRILSTLARFQNAQDLSKEAAASILMNKALRQRLRTEKDAEKRIELVREASIEENRKLRGQLTRAHAKAVKLERKAGQAIASLRERGDQQADAITRSERQLEDERAHRQRLEEQLDKLEKAQQSLGEQQYAKAQVRAFALKWITAPLALIAALGLGTSIPLATLSELSAFWSALTAIAVCSVSLVAWVWAADLRGSSDPSVSQWRPFRLLPAIKKWVLATLLAAPGILVLQLIANELSGLIRDVR